MKLQRNKYLLLRVQYFRKNYCSDSQKLQQEIHKYKSMQYNQSIIQLDNSQTLSEGGFKHTKIIQILPADSTVCQQNSQYIQDIILDSTNDLKSCESDTLRSSNKTTFVFKDHDPEPLETQESSIRKLYNNMKRFEKVQEEVLDYQLHFHSYQVNHKHQRQQDFQPEQDQSYEEQQVKTIISHSIRELVNEEIVKNKMIECIIRVSQTTIFSKEKIIELYSLKQQIVLLRAKKSKLSLSSNYVIYGLSKKPEELAVIKSNLSRTQYKITPIQKIVESEKITEIQPAFSSSLIKLNPVKIKQKSLISTDEISYLAFESNILKMNQQRVTILKPIKKVGRSDRFSDLKASYLNFEFDRVEVFTSKLASTDKTGKLCLDFKTKNIVNSARNMIIENEIGDICLTFCKRKEGIYLLNILHPFTILEGFFIAVCNLDNIFF